MSLKVFLKPTKGKIILSIITFLCIAFLSFTVGRNQISKAIHYYQGVRIVSLTGARSYKLNPILWLPAPIITSSQYTGRDHVSLQDLYMQSDLVGSRERITKLTLITIPYWIILSYFLSSSIIFIFDKIRKGE